MTKRKRQVDLLILFLSFLISVRIADSRYINTGVTENSLSPLKTPTNDLVDDVDLEVYLEDYYDELWQYFETWGRDEAKNKKKTKEKVRKEKWNFENYDYMSDMAVAEPEVGGKNFKSLGEDVKADTKENPIWSYINDPGANDSNGESGIPDVVKANRESNSQEEYPLRSKRMRVKTIMEQVLSFRGGNPKLNETIPDVKQYDALREIYEKNIQRIKNEEWTSSYTEKVQSFYPSCDLPRNTDEDVWSDSYSLNLLFDLEYPSPQEDSTIMIVSAKLRLYKLPQENYSLPNVETSTTKDKWEKTHHGLNVLPTDDDRQIRVSVYWYTRSLRRHRVKKKLLDSQMISLYGPKWAEFNIRPAVRTWKESGKNFGLVVNVEDEDGSLLPAEQYIQSMNCSKWTATARPIPSIIMDRVNQYYVDNTGESRNETAEETKTEENHKIYSYQFSSYPIIDLCTREVPNSDVKSIALVNSAKKVLESKILNLSRRGFNVTSDSIGSFLKKNNLDLKDISRQSRTEKSLLKKPESKNGERVSYFQNVPIGSPGRIMSEDSEIKVLPEKEKEEREMPKFRHNRKQQEMLQRSTNSNSWLRNNFNATDHH